MPYNANQIRLFAAAAHDKGISKSSGIPMAQAHKMLMENPKKKRSAAMRHPVKKAIMRPDSDNDKM